MKLTIGIPTFNGAHRIGETLDSVLSQLDEDLLGQVEILISDNASTDETEQVIKSYQYKTKATIVYFKQPRNMGYDVNVDSLFQRASGEYLWTLADDDTLRPRSIVELLKALKNHPDTRVVLVNFIAYDSELKTIKDLVPLEKNLVCDTAEKFLKSSDSKYSLLSSLIFSRNAWLSAEALNAVGTNFIHVYALFKILKTGKSLIISEPFVNYRQGSTNFGITGDSQLKVGLSACAVVNSMHKMGYPRHLIRWLLKKSERYIYGLVISAKLAGISNKNLIVKLLISTYPTPTVFIKLIPIIYFPDTQFAALYRTRKSSTILLRSIKNRLTSLLSRKNKEQ